MEEGVFGLPKIILSLLRADLNPLHLLLRLCTFNRFRRRAIRIRLLEVVVFDQRLLEHSSIHGQQRAY
ncbi:hypothetical protein AAHA92_14548 [Salvia divinorum]|uniref:Uncharacterized protein n=1 Tax=Salvia divinorum TaxID=28513 RepID=A0ABD1HBW7_SALDI